MGLESEMFDEALLHLVDTLSKIITNAKQEGKKITLNLTAGI